MVLLEVGAKRPASQQVGLAKLIERAAGPPQEKSRPDRILSEMLAGLMASHARDSVPLAGPGQASEGFG